MRIVIDGLPIRGQSLAIVVEHLLEGWVALHNGDELHLVVGPDAELGIPAEVNVHRVRFGKNHSISRMRAQTFALPRLCRRLSADVMLGTLATTTMSPLSCPRAIIAYDLRHELRPEQFSTRARILRTRSYSIGYRQADAIICISERTRQDLLTSRPWLARRSIGVAHLGSDHVDAWPARTNGGPYAIAFGQYGNKNVDLVIDAWALLRGRGNELPLVLVGLSSAARLECQEKVDRLGLASQVSLQPWLSDEQFRERFVSSSMVVFPSDFEGFGMPAVEAMRRGIPVVITPEQALLEVCDGHATVMNGWDVQALADAVAIAQRIKTQATEAALVHATTFTWARTAEQTRATLDSVLRTRRADKSHDAGSLSRPTKIGSRQGRSVE